MQDYIKKFERLGVGLFVHFGLYSIVGEGEWFLKLGNVKTDKYEALTKKFKVNKNWAIDLVKTAKGAGAKYITLTTRHHDGFSLYDTKGLSDYDALHSAAGRDLIKEFVDACHVGGIVPFFYHTLLDWHKPEYSLDFPKYMDYLISSIELLCTNYGKIGGFWFDGMWDKPNEDWQEDRLYATIRKHQPNAMIINNTGLSEQGMVGHPEIDSVTFERGKPCFVDNSDKHRAGEMCQILNDHWGYAKNDCNYKSVKELIGNLIDCRRYNCNFLLNTGLRGNGAVNLTDKGILSEFGKWIKANKNFIYEATACDITAENAIMLKCEDCYYAVISDVPMRADPNVAAGGALPLVKVDAEIIGATWLDSGKKIQVKDNSFIAEPFNYGKSFWARVAKLSLKDL